MSSVRVGLICFLLAACSTRTPLLPPAVANSQTSLSPEVSRLVSFVTGTVGEPATPEIARLAVDAGSAAVSQLDDVLREDSHPEFSRRAAIALAYIGGEEAIAALREHYARTRDTWMKSLLVSSMSSADSTSTRTFLTQSLPGEHYGDEWTPIVGAALALGLLRASDAVPALEATADKKKGIASGAAATALRWIRAPAPSVVIPEPTEADKVIAAVIRSGIPRLDESDRFYDFKRKGTWLFSNNTWNFRTDVTPSDAPGINFDVRISPDGLRALVAVGLTFGSLNGVGYDYVMRKQADEWRPQAIFFTWIS